jgi:hypothetical protein
MANKDPIATLVAQERELISHQAVVGDTDPSNPYKVTQPPHCFGCGGVAHGPVNQLVSCLTQHLAASRTRIATVEAELEDLKRRAHIGVSPADFEANRLGSIEFENRRGKNKKTEGA